jgi:hypothetical protein
MLGQSHSTSPWFQLCLGFNEENEAHGNIDLQTLMQKFQKLRQNRNKCFAHFF